MTLHKFLATINAQQNLIDVKDRMKKKSEKGEEWNEELMETRETDC